jgi:hypothetical protein
MLGFGVQIPMMEKHGLTTFAVFVPVGENPDGLLYLCSVPDA